MPSMNQAASKLFNTLHSQKIYQTAAKVKPGQILAGKVVKLYPDQKASIQFGGKQIIAQLEAPLTANGKYWFQVATVGEVIRLKVLSNKVTSDQSSQGIAALLEELGVKNTKDRTALVGQLLSKKIPFQKETILQAFQLMDGQGNKTEARSLIVEMISRKLPLTSPVLQAVQAKKEQQFGALLAETQHLLEESAVSSATREALTNRLNGFTYQKNAPLMNLLQTAVQEELKRGDTNLFQMMKKAGVITDSTTFTEWQNTWKTSQSSSGQMNGSLVIQAEPHEVIKGLHQLQQMQLTLSKSYQELLVALTDLAENQAKGELSPLEKQKMASLQTQLVKSDFLSSIPTRLPHKYSEAIHQLIVNESPDRESIDVVRQVIDRQLPKSSANVLLQLLSDTTEGQTMLLTDPKQYFLRKLEQVFLFSGVNHENNLLKDQLVEMPIKEQTLKSILFQALSDSGSKTAEKLDGLLHYLNGLQLTHSQETVNTVQVNLMLPGDHIGVKKDIQIDFEGNKDETGKINPDFCHIVFYLDLEKMKETVIDMQIQKRMVRITVFNENQRLENLFPLLKSKLQQGLENLDYHLTSVQWKPFEESNICSPVQAAQTELDRTQGVDFRI
ncbi:hypothetical protein ERJ70_08835 [Sediminibacillus dalangtanensis]|uniref:Hook-length control protein FliK n=1 Tax=Sediminibacillus dalangtanensis TaxID=2729421 RepID=A0ABX7VS98_9BACI|nr:hypothetical protein [Sediminibacillus dalangtanensis]QTM99398.1 hypothetical protein ERJ70_08835 [Sediminibacillus dalangtanensis]